MFVLNPPAKLNSVTLRCAAIVGIVGMVAACSGAPWLDTRREAGTLTTIGEATSDRPAYCHGTSTPLAQIQALATAECAKSGRSARYVGTEKWQCRMTTPHRSVFECF